MILATLNLTDGEWSVVEDGDSSSVAVGFTSENERTEFDNLSFGWNLSINSEETKSVLYPETPDITYISTDQNHMSFDSITVLPEDECSLFLWAENSGKRYEKTYQWVVSRPEPTCSSWVWNEETKVWEAPTPMPQDGKRYVWDETSTSWILYGLED